MTSPVTRAVSASGRIEFLSRYKGFLAVLVVLIHTGISYGAVGGWLFTEQHDVLWLKVLATCIGSFSQSFVLGAFFFVSACFLPRSLEKRGPARFFADRLLKLGVPYVLYYFLVMPFLITIAERAKGNPIPFGPYFDSGPLWFIEALFIFTLVSLAVKMIRGPSRPPLLPRGPPSALPSGSSSRSDGPCTISSSGSSRCTSCSSSPASRRETRHGSGKPRRCGSGPGSRPPLSAFSPTCRSWSSAAP